VASDAGPSRARPQLRSETMQPFAAGDDPPQDARTMSPVENHGPERPVLLAEASEATRRFSGDPEDKFSCLQGGRSVPVGEGRIMHLAPHSRNDAIGQIWHARNHWRAGPAARSSANGTRARH